MLESYNSKLQTGSTTLARCFLVIRSDGSRLGFTDHDENIYFNGNTYLASAALSASEASQALGMTPDELDASGALSHEIISETDIARGVYDGAEVLVYDVDWMDTECRALLGRYSIGEIERGGVAFRAELRSSAAKLDIAKGRTHTVLCDIRHLGSTGCNVDLANWQTETTVLSASTLDITVSGLTGFGAGVFDRGIATWLNGQNAGENVDIRLVRGLGENTVISLWRAPPYPVTRGDKIQLTAGCNRTSEMCKSRFDNLINFRGFPFMPGEEISYEAASSGSNGGSRFE